MSNPPPPPQPSAELLRLFDRLDVMDYYELLGVDEKADYLKIRQVHRDTRGRVAPERFEGDKHERTRVCAKHVVARLDEALGIVGDPWLRPRYDKGRKRGQLRASAELREELAPLQPGQSPFTRVYLEITRSKIARGEPDAAIRDMMLAISCEDSPSEAVDQLHEELLAAINEDSVAA